MWVWGEKGERRRVGKGRGKVGSTKEGWSFRSRGGGSGGGKGVGKGGPLDFLIFFLNYVYF